MRRQQKNVNTRYGWFAVVLDVEADALDYASTLCMIAVDQERYVSLNLGDGCIGAWNQDKAKIISRPLNSFGGYTAYLTVDENIEGYIKIGRGDASNGMASSSCRMA